MDNKETMPIVGYTNPSCCKLTGPQKRFLGIKESPGMKESPSVRKLPGMKKYVNIMQFPAMKKFLDVKMCMVEPTI